MTSEAPEKVKDTLNDILNEIVMKDGRRVKDMIPRPGRLFVFSSRVGLSKSSLGSNILVPDSEPSLPLWTGQCRQDTQPVPTTDVSELADTAELVDEDALSCMAASTDFESDLETTDILSPSVDGEMTFPSIPESPMDGSSSYGQDDAVPNVPAPGPYAQPAQSISKTPSQSSMESTPRTTSAVEAPQASGLETVLPAVPESAVLTAPIPLPPLETHALIEHYGMRTAELAPVPWVQAKVGVPRIIMTKLAYAMVIRSEIEAERAEEEAANLKSSVNSYETAHAQITTLCVEVEEYLLAQHQPWGNMGSSHPLHAGDYDFCSVTLAYILLRHGPQGSKLLSAEVCDHVAKNLLPPLRSTMKYRIPSVMGVHTIETENHILMINATHCLRWLYLRCSNPPRALTAGLEHHLLEVRDRGLWEFNSRPYSVYYFLALLILEEVGTHRLVQLARQVLDSVTFAFALGSNKLRRNDPFRRRVDRAKATSLYDHPLSSLMMVWMARSGIMDPEIAALQASSKLSKAYASYAALFRYTPPLQTLQLAWDYSLATGSSPIGYYVRMGHGGHSCPEVYTRTTNWILCAGGATVEKLIVTRPIALMWNDDKAEDRRDLLRIKGKGHYSEWNMTGVFFNVAIAEGTVDVPETEYTKVEVESQDKGAWTGYQPNGRDKALVVVHRGNGDSSPAVIMVFEAVENCAKAVRVINGMCGKLKEKGVLLLPNQSNPSSWSQLKSVHYDITVEQNQWPIIQVNNAVMPHPKFEDWPLFDVHGTVVSDERSQQNGYEISPSLGEVPLFVAS
eukprot:m.131237 g.131237  ORF g.131237 m.131237 type:complete len:793 (-) comp15905_c0_seq2:85-2463(-)